MSLRQDVHDKLWRAFQRWEDLRQTGIDKHELKMKGIREAGDPNRFTRNLIFTGNTLRSYETVLKSFVEQAAKDHGVTQVRDIGKRDFRAFMDRSIAKGLAVKTLNRYKSALAKLGALIGKTESFAALSAKYGANIRELAKAGTLPTPTRMTPSREVLQKAVGILRQADARHFARTGEYRAYHLAARLQAETSARSISVTHRFTSESLREGNRVALIGKGGKEQFFTVSPELHSRLRSYFSSASSGPLASLRGYQSAYARAMKAAGGRVSGTHGARRASVQDFYANRYKQAVGQGASPAQAAASAAADAIERLGHGRDRMDHRSWYLGK